MRHLLVQFGGMIRASSEEPWSVWVLHENEEAYYAVVYPLASEHTLRRDLFVSFSCGVRLPSYRSSGSRKNRPVNEGAGILDERLRQQRTGTDQKSTS